VIKYVVSLILGLIVGVIAVFLLLYFNPLVSGTTLSPLTVTDNEVITLNYPAVAAESIAFTNDGESEVEPHPAKVLQLWEAPIRDTTAMVSVLKDSRNQAVGIGVKFSSRAESTNILNAQANLDSVWQIYLPARGSLFIDETENYWDFLRDIVVPAYWSSGDNWRGIWHGITTSGPGALGTARVVGGSGDFAGIDSDAVESLSAQAYSVEHGPVAMTGQLDIELQPEATTSPPGP
jgi:hypothetical protein